MVGRVLRLGGIAQDRPGQPIGGIESIVREMQEGPRTLGPGSTRTGLLSAIPMTSDDRLTMT